MSAPVLVWFRRDLRLGDNPALRAAVDSGRPVVPVFIHDDDAAGEWRPGGASRWWLHHSLAALTARIARLGGRLVLKAGPSAGTLATLIAETGAAAVFWNRLHEPWAVRRDARIKRDLRERGIEVRSFNASLLNEPWTVLTGRGAPYRVFTPYYRAVRARGAPEPPTPPPERICSPAARPRGDTLEDLSLLPRAPDWAGGLRSGWQPGEVGAGARLQAFADAAMANYADERDIPGIAGTSRLSPHLHFGEVGPRQVWHALSGKVMHDGTAADGLESFLREIAWREFSASLLFHFPQLPDRPLRPEFAGFVWNDDPAGLRAWQRGATGYPIVDAGMRELWATGWMHNRVRMITASFLVKDLLIDWRVGARWFWDTLVDADLANNAAGWQWVAGSGADAAPYFRVFNPSLQGMKFDPSGTYVRRWVPELARLPDALIHTPWKARAVDLADAGVAPGRTYPAPIVDHRKARLRALRRHARLGAAKPGAGSWSAM